jgi:hypothetical protein
MNKYHVDALGGNDSRNGLTPATAWKSLSRANRQNLRPGDSLLFKRGCSWKGTLLIHGSGTRSRRISIGTYGAGPRPRIASPGGVVLGNKGPVSWWRISGLDLCGTRTHDPRFARPGNFHGLAIRSDRPCTGISVDDCVVHDIPGTGISFANTGGSRNAFREWSITGCDVYNAGTGITSHGPWPAPADAADCHVRFRVAGCRTHDIATDGIVLSHCRDGVIEHCTAWRTGIGITRRTPVGIWFYLAYRCVIQFSESFDNHCAGGRGDGGGFDLDGGCIDCVMQYNYSHDNDGAGLLICSYDPKNAPCTGCVTRFNVSINDGRANDYPSILFWQAYDCQTYNNTCITRIATPLKFTSETHGHLIANNIFMVDSGGDVPLVKSAFAVDANTFRNNLYYKSGGKARFEVRGQKNLDLKGFSRLVRSSGEVYSNPGLATLKTAGVFPESGSPCAGRGISIKGMGNRDFAGAPLGKQSRPPIGCCLPRKK